MQIVDLATVKFRTANQSTLLVCLCIVGTLARFLKSQAWKISPTRTFFAQSMRIKLASPQAARLSVFFIHRKIISVAPPRRT